MIRREQEVWERPGGNWDDVVVNAVDNLPPGVITVRAAEMLATSTTARPPTGEIAHAAGPPRELWNWSRRHVTGPFV